MTEKLKKIGDAAVDVTKAIGSPVGMALGSAGALSPFGAAAAGNVKNIVGGLAGQGPAPLPTFDPAAERARLLAEVQAGREADMARGRARGQELFGTGSLGRLGADPVVSGQAPAFMQTQAREGSERAPAASAPASPLFSGGLVGRSIQQAQQGAAQAQAQQAQQAAANQSAQQAGQLVRAQEVADIIARRQAGLEGFNAEELAAQRAQMSQGIGRAEQTALRQLRGAQGAAGLRG
ncbi:MAG: hypothetical protein R3204_16830, partial [Oceanospirillum sp.]|nr:hypothetical protein [Oceanospirillum sp.]